MARYTRNTVHSLSGVNTELTKIQAAILDTLSRKGDAPNQMEGALDMNSERIINLPDPVSDHEPMTKKFGEGIVEAAEAARDSANAASDSASLSATSAAASAASAAVSAQAAQQYTEDGQLAAALAAPDSTVLVGGVVAKDISNGFYTYERMIANYFGVLSDGDTVRTGSTVWRITDTISDSAVVIANTTPQLYAIPLNGVWVADFGVINDGHTNNFAALKYTEQQCKSNWALNFGGGIVKIEYTDGLDISRPYGQIACNFQAKKNIKVNGNATTIQISHHNVTANGGLMVFGHDAVQGLEITGFTFDLSFIGRNTSASYYPFNGAILGLDSLGTPGARTDAQLSSGINVHHNTFKIFHPEGCYGKSGNPFALDGDPNNGFKNYSYTALGDDTATSANNQNKDVTFSNNNFLKGHNGYGVWVWAYNNFIADYNVSNGWIAGVTDEFGAWQGFSSIPMIRYIKFYCNGATIGGGNRCISLPMSERVGSFQGAAIYVHVTDNMSVDVDVGGFTKVSGATKLGTGDVGILVGVYGSAQIHDVEFSAHSINDRPTALIDIQPFTGGVATYSISNCNTDKRTSAPLVRIENGAPTAALRRLKNLSIRNCNALNCLDSAVTMVNNRGAAVRGVERIDIQNCFMDGELSQFDPLNTNKAAVSLNLINVATDKVSIRNSTIRHFYNMELHGSAVSTIEGISGENITASQDYNYLPISEQTRVTDTFAAGVIPRVGVSNVDLFSFSARRIVVASGVTQQVSSGTVAGGSSLSGATPTGEVWYIDRTLIASKQL